MRVQVQLGVDGMKEPDGVPAICGKIIGLKSHLNSCPQVDEEVKIRNLGEKDSRDIPMDAPSVSKGLVRRKHQTYSHSSCKSKMDAIGTD